MVYDSSIAQRQMMQGIQNPKAIQEELRPYYDGTLFGRRGPAHLLANDPAVEELCVMCNQNGDIQCECCKATYCSTNCRDTDWPLHDLICKQLATTCANSKRPEGHIRYFLFPTKGKKPKLVWIKNDDDIAETAVLRADTDFTPRGAFCDMINVNASMPRRRIGKVLICKMLDRIKRSGTNLPINESMIRLSSLGQARVEHGPVLVKAYVYSRLSPLDPRRSDREDRDVTARDFRTVVDFFRTMKANPCVVDIERFPRTHYNCDIWPAVKLNCREDSVRFRPFAELVDQTEDSASLIIERVRVPSVSLFSPRRPVLRAKHLSLNWIYELCSTNVDIQPASGVIQNDIFAAAISPVMDSVPAPSNPGSFMIIHERVVALDCLHVFRLARFLAYNDRTLHIPVSTLTRADFERFWNTREITVPSGVPSPYSLEDGH
ncbi:Uu.00g056300.m01.CDS01 [Anthostomella pinea]|uniref:Uu.00g056300.m01.CDS01 n=1 Tax=Anthostomella pinea TaxID=933095 RepID=A0AAI8VKX7_9PEZI|nr:Uu.00g056300.m01.CDS01 [Anthostomella pinea]